MQDALRHLQPNNAGPWSYITGCTSQDVLGYGSARMSGPQDKPGCAGLETSQDVLTADKPGCAGLRTSQDVLGHAPARM